MNNKKKMKSLYLILSIFIFSGFSIKAEEKVYERAFVHTDKDCYVAGEDILIKFFLIDNNFQPSTFSKVGYVEICDIEKPQIQLKIALEKGHGAGKIKVPMDIPSGLYQLSAYTRYMKNEGENVFFKKHIAIINPEQQVNNPKQFELVENFENIQREDKTQLNGTESVNLLIKTDKNEYGKREKVTFNIDNIPENTTDLVISVSRNDSLVFVPEINRQMWLKQVKDTYSFSQNFTPEYEGHIISGRIVPEVFEKQFRTNISFVGNDIRYFMGQLNTKNGTVNFYTADTYGKQHVVTSITSMLYDTVSYRIDLVSPFFESIPKSLPLLQIYSNENLLLERYVGAQIQDKIDNDSLKNSIQYPEYFNVQPVKIYDLNQYTRFESIAETILEFVSRLHVSKVRGNRVISAFLEEEKRFSLRTLVLLDGIPVYNHEDILQYNPLYIRYLNIYDGRFMFGNDSYEGIVSFITEENNLPFFQLGKGVQLFDYECPQLPPLFENPDYSAGSISNSRKPDFRHTLYWNPFAESIKTKPNNISFYTSDLCGEFIVTVEGVTRDGKVVKGRSSFVVKGVKGS